MTISRQTPRSFLFSSAQKLRHCVTKLLFEFVPLPAWRVLRLCRKINDGLQFRRNLMPVAEMYSYMSSLVKHVRFACQCPPCSFRSKRKSCLLFRDKSVNSHFAKSGVNLLLPHIARYWIHQP